MSLIDRPIFVDTAQGKLEDFDATLFLLQNKSHDLSRRRRTKLCYNDIV